MCRLSITFSSKTERGKRLPTQNKRGRIEAREQKIGRAEDSDNLDKMKVKVEIG